MFFYIRCINEIFETKRVYELKKALRCMFNDVSHRIAEPLAIIDEKGNSVYNRKELIQIYSDECKKGVQSWLFEKN